MKTDRRVVEVDDSTASKPPVKLTQPPEPTKGWFQHPFDVPWGRIPVADRRIKPLEGVEDRRTCGRLSSAATSDGGAGNCSWDPAGRSAHPVSRDHSRASPPITAVATSIRGPNTRVINGNIGRILK